MDNSQQSRSQPKLLRYNQNDIFEEKAKNSVLYDLETPKLDKLLKMETQKVKKKRRSTQEDHPTAE